MTGKAPAADPWLARQAELRELGRQRAEGAPPLDAETREQLRAILAGSAPVTAETVADKPA